MSAHNHAVIWIDHHDAHVIFFDAEEMDERIIHAPPTAGHIHSKAGSPSGTHTRPNSAFFEEVAEALLPARAVLVIGPSEAKTEFVAYLDHNKHPLHHNIVDVRAAQRMTDKQIVAEARRYFKAADRLNPVFDLTAGKGVGAK